MTRFSMVLAAMLAAMPCLWTYGAEEMKPLKTEMPEEVLAGTPPDVLAMLFPGLELPDPAKQKPIMVPVGTVNLALKKPVTSSDPNPLIGKLAFINDGVKEGKEETYLELSPQAQWVQIDLGASSRIYAVHLWHFFREARSYQSVVIQVSDDKSFSKNVQTVFNTDTKNKLKFGIGKDRPYIETYQGKPIAVKGGAKGRYVRLYSDGNTANNYNHYVEVEVFGEPAS